MVEHVRKKPPPPLDNPGSIVLLNSQLVGFFKTTEGAHQCVIVAKHFCCEYISPMFALLSLNLVQ